ncbi:MAG: anaerobic sulfatase maturase [Lachnospiraceae bacterium]|nr:anaerobic sulfatase maturase [Lachnospiraceae bacterium]
MPPLSVLIKPASSACNMNCDYCFYRDVANHRTEGFRGMISSRILEQAVSSLMEYAEGSIHFLFQGGEPTLAGLDFYRQTTALQKKYGRSNLAVYNSLQTNGYIIDEEWARFLSSHHFLVGLSLDGTQPLHDAHRRCRQGEGTFQRVAKAARLFDTFGTEYNILSVLTDHNTPAIDEIYSFFKSQGFHWLQFIPCLPPLDVPALASDLCLSSDYYAKFLIRIFDLWLEDIKRGQYISIRHLDNWLSILLGSGPASCGMMGRCSIQLVIESDGSVYPCDFYVLDEWKLGNIMTDYVSDMIRSQRASDFIKLSVALPEQCRCCSFYPLCRNGCRRERLPGTEQEPGINRYCSAYKEFFSTRGKLLQWAATLLAQRR